MYSKNQLALFSTEKSSRLKNRKNKKYTPIRRTKRVRMKEKNSEGAGKHFFSRIDECRFRKRRLSKLEKSNNKGKVGTAAGRSWEGNDAVRTTKKIIIKRVANKTKERRRGVRAFERRPPDGFGRGIRRKCRRRARRIFLSSESRFIYSQINIRV